MRGKEEQLLYVFKELNIDIIRLSETNEKGEEELILEDEYLLIYGVFGCKINRRLITNNIKTWEQHSERILSIEMVDGKRETTIIITVYRLNDDENYLNEGSILGIT